MPRDSDKDNDSRGRRDRGPAKGRSGKPRGPEKKFAKRGPGGKGGARDDRPPRGDRDSRPVRRREDGDAPRRDFSDRPRFKRDDRPREDRGERSFKPRGDRPNFDRGDRAPRGERPERKFEDRKFSRGAPDRGPRKDFGGRDRGADKPWQKREGGRGEERPRFSRSRDDRASGDRPFRERPKFDRPRDDRPKFDRPRRDSAGERGGRGGDRPKFDRPRERSEGRSDWHEHPRSEGRAGDRPRRENEDDSRIFEKRPAFGGRGAYRERDRDSDRRPRREEEPKPKKAGERIAKALARAGLASRRDAEEMVTQGRVAVNGRVINSPALDITSNDVVTVDGKPLPERERTRLFLYHKPRGLMTTHADPEGGPTASESLREGRR